MVRNLFTEKFEYFTTRFKTSLGLFDLFVGSAIWGFLIVKYKDDIHNHIINLLNFLPKGFIQDYFSYLLFSLVLMLLGLAITYVLTYIFLSLFKNKKVL